MADSSDTTQPQTKVIDFCARREQKLQAHVAQEQGELLSSAAHIARGSAYRESGDYASAILEFTRAYALDDTNVELCLDLGTILGEERHYENAIFYLQRATELAPDNAEAHYFLGMAYMGCRPAHARHAIAAFQQCLVLDPSISQVNIYIAEAWRSLGSIQQAIDILEEFLEAEEGNTEALNLLAVLYLELEQIDEAIEALRRAIQHAPGDASLYVNLGVAYLHRGFLDMSVLQFKKATQLDPQDPNAFYNLAHTLAKRGDPDQAVNYVHRAIALEPDNPNFYLLLASALFAQHCWEEAKEPIEKVLEMDPDNPMACGFMGRYFQEAGEVEEAIYWFKQSVELDSYNSEWHLHIAICYVQQGDLEKGYNAINKAININDQIAGYHILRGDIRFNMGQKSRAETSWKEALRLDSELERDVEQRLNGDVPKMIDIKHK